MASHETMVSGYESDDQNTHLHSLSRLSVCSNSMYTNEDDDIDLVMGNSMSRLSIESFDADDEGFFKEKTRNLDISSGDDSGKEPGCYSLPSSPAGRRNRVVRFKGIGIVGGGKDYASENEVQKRENKGKNLRKRRLAREKWKKREDENSNSDDGGGGGGRCSVVMITRAKGGNRSLCMDMDEVKACRDLGFELEHDNPCSSSSACSSPISNWCISSPGDDPRDVKARLKVWAQAVALVSTSQRCA